MALPRGGLIASSIPGPEGWRARDDTGAALEAVRIDGAFLGVRVPAGGVGAITLSYLPPGFALGAALGLAALAVVAALSWVDRSTLWTLAVRTSGVRRTISRARLAAIAATAVAIYLGASLVLETIGALEPYWLRGPHSFRERNPARWRLASAPVDRLRAFLSEIEPLVPPGSRIAFAGEELVGTEGAYRAMWAAYLLPRHHVLPAGQAWDADFYVAYHTRLERPELELVWESDDGALYRSARAAVGASR